MSYLYALTALALIGSLLADSSKSIQALKIALKRMVAILPSFLTMLILVSIVLYLVPGETMVTYLGGRNKWLGTLSALLFGSVTIMPGFIAFPLSSILLEQGISHMTIAAFTNSLMMVGVLTFPVEQKYFGTMVTIIRNVISLIIVIIIALIMGLAYGEVF